MSKRSFFLFTFSKAFYKNLFIFSFSFLNVISESWSALTQFFKAHRNKKLRKASVDVIEVFDNRINCFDDPTKLYPSHVNQDMKNVTIIPYMQSPTIHYYDILGLVIKFARGKTVSR